MNALKAFFELNWVPYLSRMTYLMGYKSDSAQYTAKKCSDHHQSWEFLLIFFFGSLRELITLYVRNEIESNTDEDKRSFNVEGFLAFTKNMDQCPNYIHLLSQVMNYAFAVINFRMALRRNNLKLAQSAMYKLSDLFYGRIHPFYQLIECHFSAQMFCMHDEVKPLFGNFFTISMSGDPSKGESWDFVLENINKHTQGLYF